jgi:lipopolysaccharide biosynthesis glycosyltransferase
MGFKGWALFMDSDMLFLSDIGRLFALCDDKYAVMCVKHNHNPVPGKKMDDREQLRYHRKNWSSFVLWNCGHPDNKRLTEEVVNCMKGSELHAFTWLADEMIGQLPYSYNYITGVSPKLPPERGHRPDVIHFTEGGPWFDQCKDVPYAQLWVDEYEDFQTNGYISHVPAAAYEVTK